MQLLRREFERSSLTTSTSVSRFFIRRQLAVGLTRSEKFIRLAFGIVVSLPWAIGIWLGSVVSLADRRQTRSGELSVGRRRIQGGIARLPLRRAHHAWRERWSSFPSSCIVSGVRLHLAGQVKRVVRQPLVDVTATGPSDIKVPGFVQVV